MANIIQSAISKVKSLAQKSVNMLPPVQAYNAVKTMATPQFRQQAQSVADWGSNLSQQGAQFGQQIGQRIQQTPQFKINPIQDFKTSLTKKVAPTALGMVGSAPGEFVRGIAQLTRDVSEPSRIAQARFGTAKDIFNYNPQDPTKLGIAFNAVTALPDITDLGKVALMGGLATSVLKPQLEAKALKQFLPEIRNVSKMLGNMDEIPDLTPQQVKAAEEIVAKIRGSNAVAQINKLNPNAKDYFNSLRVLLSGAEDQILNPKINIGFSTKAVKTPRAAQAGLSVPSTKGVESGLNPIVKQSSSGNIYIKTGKNEVVSGLPKTIQNDLYEIAQGRPVNPDRMYKTSEFLQKKGFELVRNEDTFKYELKKVSPVTKGVESMPKTSKLSNKLVEDINKGVEEASNKLKERGFVTSVKETPNVTGKVKVKVKGMYEPKPNAELMGEAQALLQEGATIDFKNVEGVDKKVAATIQEALNAQKAGNHQLAANLFNNLSEQGTELGRGVQAFSLLPKMSPEAISLSVAGKIKKYNQTAWKKIPELTGEQQKIIADQLTALDLLKGREKNIALNELQNTLNSFIPSSLVDKGIAVWKAGLLTSLRTHERNFLGNLIHGGLEIAKDIPASIADIGLSKVTGQRTKAFTTRGVREFATKNTGQQIKDIISKGYDPSETINKFDYKTITWGNNPVEQALKKYTDTVFRTLGASDKPFYNAALSRSLYDQATTAAINAGRRGDKVFIEKLVKTPTEEMMKIAMGDANVATFKNKNAATAISSAIKNAMKSEKFGPIGSEIGKLVGEITMPFTGVPSSILGQIINYSPAGLLKGIINTGRVALTDVPNLQRQAVEELGRGIIGTGIFGLGAYLASKGLITGQPKDATEQRLWDTQNKPRNSIFLGGKWRSLNSIGPEAVVFLAGAKLNEEINNPEGSAANYALSLGKDYLDQSFVQGIKAPINALTDPARYAKSYAGNLLSSGIPSIVKDLGKSLDPYVREANTVMDYAKSSIPILRNTMLPARDVLGRPRTQEPTGIGAFIDVFNSKTPVNNDVVNELERLYQTGNNATPGKIGKSQTIGGVKKDLTPAELDQLESTVGAEGQAQLKSLINNSGYQKLSDEDKATAIGSLLTGIRKKVRGTIDLSQGVENTGVSTVTASDTPNKTYLLVNSETGTVKQVDLDSEIIYPEMTGIDLVDKKLISEYKSDINSKLSDAIKLQKDGQISLDKLREIAGETAKKLAKTKSAKKIKIKVAPLKFGKRKKITGLSSSKRFKLVRAKRIK